MGKYKLIDTMPHKSSQAKALQVCSIHGAAAVGRVKFPATDVFKPYITRKCLKIPVCWILELVLLFIFNTCALWIGDMTMKKGAKLIKNSRTCLKLKNFLILSLRDNLHLAAILPSPCNI